jgi:hypothetical protein
MTTLNLQGLYIGSNKLMITPVPEEIQEAALDALDSFGTWAKLNEYAATSAAQFSLKVSGSTFDSSYFEYVDAGLGSVGMNLVLTSVPNSATLGTYQTIAITQTSSTETINKLFKMNYGSLKKIPEEGNNNTMLLIIAVVVVLYLMNSKRL